MLNYQRVHYYGSDGWRVASFRGTESLASMHMIDQEHQVCWSSLFRKFRTNGYMMIWIYRIYCKHIWIYIYIYECFLIYECMHSDGLRLIFTLHSRCIQEQAANARLSQKLTASIFADPGRAGLRNSQGSRHGHLHYHRDMLWNTLWWTNIATENHHF